MGHSETIVDGVLYPSVTTILGSVPRPWLDAWYRKWGSLAIRKTKIASLIGTEFHRCIEQYLDTGDYVPRCPRVAGMMHSWVVWAKGVDGLIHHTELKVVSRKYVYAGTLDAVGVVDGKLAVIDWKTSSRIYSTMQLQLVAYAQAYYEQTGIRINRGLIVHVSKAKPEFRITTKTFPLGKRPLSQFLKLRAAFDRAGTGL